MTGAEGLAALVGARICHDLISPIGAIGNGLELMLLSGAEESPEMALLRDSLNHARARLRFFRLAFGSAGPGDMVRAGEITEALAGADRRAALDWAIPGDMTRRETKLALLALNCIDSAMPHGGTLRVAAQGGVLALTGRAPRLHVIEADWAHLSEAPPPPAPPAPARIQFALLPAEARAQGRRLAVERHDGEIRLTV